MSRVACCWGRSCRWWLRDVRFRLSLFLCLSFVSLFVLFADGCTVPVSSGARSINFNSRPNEFQLPPLRRVLDDETESRIDCVDSQLVATSYNIYAFARNATEYVSERSQCLCLLLYCALVKRVPRWMLTFSFSFVCHISVVSGVARLELRAGRSPLEVARSEDPIRFWIQHPPIAEVNERLRAAGHNATVAGTAACFFVLVCLCLLLLWLWRVQILSVSSSTCRLMPGAAAAVWPSSNCPRSLSALAHISHRSRSQCHRITLACCYATARYYRG